MRDPNWAQRAPAYWRDLDQAAQMLDRTRVNQICRELIAELTPPSFTFPLRQARGFLQILRGQRFFELMEDVATAFIASGQNDFQIRRQLAQAQIDQGKLDEAVRGLDRLIQDTATDAGENAEARGLLGRAWKQRYVQQRDVDPAAAATALRKAIDCYYSVCRDRLTDYIWHGINTVALLCAGARRKMDLPGYPDPVGMAREILQAIEELQLEHRAQPWDLATATEACVALRDTAGTVKWANLYVKAPYVSAFELGSYLRQCTEIWELPGASPDFAPMLALLESELLRRGHGHQEIVFGQPPAGAGAVIEPQSNLKFERVFADGRLTSTTWIDNAKDRADCVARIDDDIGNAIGTGFLIRGGNLIKELRDEPLLLTNAHVISDDPVTAAKQSCMKVLSAEEARIAFTREKSLPMETQWTVKTILWSSLPAELDATLIRLNPPPPPLPVFAAYPIAPGLPLTDGTEPVWVFGHAHGGGLVFSTRNNVLIAVVGSRLRYRAATEGGSSGGPVFNNEWKLIGVHHAGGGKPQVACGGASAPAEWNEGISMRAILEVLRQPAVTAQIVGLK
jgi:hypothetical protein